MKVYSFTQPRQRLAEVLDFAREEEVIIERRGGESFTVALRRRPKSPFDVPSIKTKAKITTAVIVEAIRETRSRSYDDQSEEQG